MSGLYVGVLYGDDGEVALLAVNDEQGVVNGVRTASEEHAVAWLQQLPVVPVVVAVVGAGPPALAGLLGYSAAPTHKGSEEWPVCIAVQPEGDQLGYATMMAWQWHHEPGYLHVQPDVREWEKGYVVVPLPTTTTLLVEVELDTADEVATRITQLPGVRQIRPMPDRV